MNRHVCKGNLSIIFPIDPLDMAQAMYIKHSWPIHVDTVTMIWDPQRVGRPLGLALILKTTGPITISAQLSGQATMETTLR